MKYGNLLFLLSLAAIPLHAQDSVPAAIQSVENHLLPAIQFADSSYQFFSLQDRMKTYNVPAVSIAVIDKGKIAWAKAYGVADLATARPATVNTLFQAASISKSVNAIAIMRLVKEGKLSLEGDIRHYLKSWKLPENQFTTGRLITIKQLLGHIAGINVSGFKGYGQTDSLPSLDQILNGQRPANSEAIIPIDYAGRRFRYSGGGTVILRKIMEDQTAETYSQIVSRRVLKPLSMQNSTYDQRPGSRRLDVATAYTGENQQVTGKYTLNPELAPDGLWTTPTDLAKFILGVQQSLSGKRPGFLSVAEVDQLLGPALDSTNAALGFFILNRGGESYFQHAGSNVGYKSNFYGSFKGDRGVVVMINCDQYDIIPEIINSVAYTYKWKDFYQPQVRKLINVDRALLSRYTGTYILESPRMEFRISQQGGRLYLSSGTDEPERMFFTKASDFFLLSSKQLTFQISDPIGKGNYELVIQQGNESFHAKRER